MSTFLRNLHVLLHPSGISSFSLSAPVSFSVIPDCSPEVHEGAIAKGVAGAHALAPALASALLVFQPFDAAQVTLQYNSLTTRGFCSLNGLLPAACVSLSLPALHCLSLPVCQPASLLVGWLSAVRWPSAQRLGPQCPSGLAWRP